MLQQQPRLSPLERREKHKLLLHDSAALCTLFGIVVALSFVTYGLFHSFMAHRGTLETRWRIRGEAAMSANRPDVAVNDLRSALAYSPDDRTLQIDLATALAASGRTQEAQSYFTTLLEQEPGSGAINLQLARLAIRQNNAQAAVDHYQLAIDGTWNGDAFIRRRELRMELARYLIALNRFAEARSLLLITSGNGPDNLPLQLQIGQLLEQADDPADALDVYRKAASHKATRLQSLEGQAHAAAALGRFSDARTLLQQAVGEPSFAHQPAPARAAVQSELQVATQIAELYPSLNLPMAERARRIARAATTAQARLLACEPQPLIQPGGQAAAQPDAQGGNPAARQSRTQLLTSLGEHISSLNPLARKPPQPPAGVPPTAPPSITPPDPLSALADRWSALATGTPLQRQLAADPVFAQKTLELVLDTERATADPSGTCGAPTGDNALWTRIAEAPPQTEGSQP
ncbi:lipopolysaccharide assembly protein LapB [Acidipila sp. EB88]|uniref:tetratricopeptide repeat protein n=1 Tax=Acidipila sp. EB88 TaxID=2305226 RepID=UPI000F5DCA04|nr:tetratricopeptide repeat protein [Acidipila sp. EB88]RRA49013.1 hypothetical protein D1Y84_12735 [Acidipila sp. EB88]